MTSLCPGPLFSTPGLNHYSTPSSRTDTPSDTHGRHSRVPFNGIPWPKPSPVTKVYDVRNSSTKMILLNNKYSKKSGQSEGNGVTMKGCRLRGQTLHEGDVKSPDPDRHSNETPYVNRRSHIDCGNTSSPVFKPTVKTNLKWANSSQRPPLKFEDGSSVNYKRHTTCMVSDDLRMMNWHRPRRPYSTSIIRESMRSQSPLLDDLNPGERLYMYSIARVYSVDSMRKIKQSQYCHLLHREVERGGYSTDECERYWKYLSRPRKTQQGPQDTYQRRRIKSAPSHRQKDAETERSQSRQTTERPSETSRSTSMKSKSKSSSRPISRASMKSSRSYKQKTQEETTPDTKTDKTGTKSDKTSSSRRQRVHSPEDTQTVTQVELQESQDDDSSQNEVQARGEDKGKDSEKSDEEDCGNLRETKHKEGRDRPKSRLGGRARKTADSDDDYSTDSSSSNSSSDELDTEKTTSKSVSTSEPTKSSKSSKSTPVQEQPESKKSSKPEESTVTESMAASSDKHDKSYSEDFTDTSASENANQAKGGKSDEKQQSDNSVSENTASKTTSSEATVSKSQEKSGEYSDTSASESVSRKQTSDENTDASSSLKPPARKESKSDSDTESTTDTSTSEDMSKSSSTAQKVKVSDDEVKVKDDEVKVKNDEVKVSDQSYSDDFTESQSHVDDKSKGKSDEVKKSGENTASAQSSQENDSKMAKEENENGQTSSKRRDSVEMDREGRVRDWDKIEY